MKKLALFDIDKTIYNSHSFFGLVTFLIEQGKISEDVQKKVDAAYSQYKQGKLSYTDTAHLCLEALASGLTQQDYTEIYLATLDFFKQNKSNFYSYFIEILSELLQKYDVYVVTTNTQFAAQAVVEIFGLNGYLATEFEVAEGKFTGKISNSLANGKSLVSDLIAKYGKSGSIACGDSENDIGMLELVENPICIDPTDNLKKHALANSWTIANHENANLELAKLSL